MPTIQERMGVIEERQRSLEKGQERIIEGLSDLTRSVDTRLNNMDDRIEAIENIEAENRGMRKIIIGLGTVVVGGLMGLGGLVLAVAAKMFGVTLPKL